MVASRSHSFVSRRDINNVCNIYESFLLFNSKPVPDYARSLFKGDLSEGFKIKHIKYGWLFSYNCRDPVIKIPVAKMMYYHKRIHVSLSDNVDPIMKKWMWSFYVTDEREKFSTTIDNCVEKIIRWLEFRIKKKFYQGDRSIFFLKTRRCLLKALRYTREERYRYI